MEQELKQAFEACGYEAKFAKVVLSNRPDLCEYQCNGAMAAAKAYKKKHLDIAAAVVEKLTGASADASGAQAGGGNPSGAQAGSADAAGIQAGSAHPVFSEAGAVMPGFINLKVSGQFLAEYMLSRIHIAWNWLA